jgi:hypothetical protein
VVGGAIQRTEWVGGNPQGDPEGAWDEGKIGRWPRARQGEWDGNPPLKNILKAEAVAKSGNDTRVGMSNWRGGGRDDGKSKVIYAFVRGCR